MCTNAQVFLTSFAVRARAWICVWTCLCVCLRGKKKCARIEAMFFNSHWIKAFYNPLSRHNSTSLTMDLSLLCLLIIVLIHMISCFMIPLAFSLSRHAMGTNISTSALWNYNFLSSVPLGSTGWRTVVNNPIVLPIVPNTKYCCQTTRNDQLYMYIQVCDGKEKVLEDLFSEFIYWRYLLKLH